MRLDPSAAITALGGRRYVLVLLCGAATTFLQYVGKLDPAGSTYALVIGATVGAYIAGNVTQKIKAPTEKDNQ